MSSPIDWQVAERRAAGLAPPGPRGSQAELQGVVTSLHGAARQAPEHVAAITGLHTAAESVANGPVYVVDRPRWAEANIAMFAELTDGLLSTVTLPGASRIGGEELGIMLGLLSTKVLGQYDPFTAPPATGGPGESGRLLLVAPNVLHVERQLDFDAMDFRLWVCLHEQTHALQFAAAPWLADHLTARMRGLLTSMTDPAGGAERLRRALRAALDLLRGETQSATAPPLLDAVLTPAERAEMDELVAIMSLLEGHADVIMDAVGPRVLPSVRAIRRSFERRREGRGLLDIMLRRLLGMDAKIAQYRSGAAFVRAVLGEVGHEGLNAVWQEAAMLPSPAEIADPAAWVRRVHG